jgi:DNA-binding transcriptional LysR family regulator
MPSDPHTPIMTTPSLRREDLGDLLNLLAVAQEGSFTRAAARLGLSQSALSHAIARFEERLGVRLLNRTTRSVAPTEAGAALIESTGPALGEIGGRLAALSSLRDRPSGHIRITSSDHAASSILWPVVERLTRENPEISVEINVDSALTDIVTERFDAGVRLGEQVARDMIAVRIGPRLRMAAVAAPAYVAAQGVPLVPQDLSAHRCINMRMASAGGLYVWEFSKDGRNLNVRVDGQLTFNRVPMILEAAMAGHGIAMVMEDMVEQHIASGALVRVLEDWCEPFDGYYLYYPSRRQPLPAFALLVEALRYRD